jgi:hypothetical protein
MGNAGDLMKHGLLAQFTAWWCRLNSRRIRFIDPFGGRPWVAPPVPTVVDRVNALSEFALSVGQPHPEKRYYGSAHVVRRVAEAAGPGADILVSDRDPLALRDLMRSGLKKIQHPRFDPLNGYSILMAGLDADLILIDPFDSFVSTEAPFVVPKVSKTSASVATVVFVLIPDLWGAEVERYAALKARYLSHSWSLRCPPVRHTTVRGEAVYIVEVLLVAPKLLQQPAAASLRQQLERYAERLSAVLGERVRFCAG